MWGKNIKHYLELSGRTQKDLANAIGVTEATLSHYIKGKRDPHVTVLQRIANELEVTLDDLMETPEVFKLIYLKPKEKAMLLYYRALDPKTQELIYTIFEQLNSADNSK